MKIKQAFLSGIIFLGTILIWFVWFAAYTNLPTQNPWDLMTANIWNTTIARINSIWSDIDSIKQKLSWTYNSWKFCSSDANWVIQCNNTISSNITWWTCAAWSYVSGINTNWSPICTVLPSSSWMTCVTARTRWVWWSCKFAIWSQTSTNTNCSLTYSSTLVRYLCWWYTVDYCCY